MKKLIIVVASLSLLLMGAAFAQESSDGDQQASSAEQIAEMCEARYSAEEYTDENERNGLIDKCIDEATNAASQGDQG